MVAVLGKDYIETKIDSRMIRSKEVIDRLRKGRGGGIPWMVILDGEGRELITSDGPDGNCGCPVMPEEVDWFMTMIQKTSQHMTEGEVATVRKSLQAFADEILKKRG